MSNETTQKEQHHLVRSILKWVRILDECVADLAKTPDHLRAQFERYDFNNLTKDQLNEVRSRVFKIPTNAHLIAISLRQLDEHARELERFPIWSGEIAKYGNQFRMLVTSTEIRDLRDVIA
jgi:hypothetical protein